MRLWDERDLPETAIGSAVDSLVVLADLLIGMAAGMVLALWIVM